MSTNALRSLGADDPQRMVQRHDTPLRRQGVRRRAAASDIPRELAAQLASQLDNLQRRHQASCNAKVWGKDRNYGIWLDSTSRNS